MTLAYTQRDERVLVVWSDNLDFIIPTCRDFEDKLIKLVWRARPPLSSSASALTAGSLGSLGPQSTTQSTQNLTGAGQQQQPAERAGESAPTPSKGGERKKRSFLFGWRVTGKNDEKAAAGEKDVETWKPEPRPIRLFAPIYGGLGAGLSVFFIGSGLNILIQVSGDVMLFVILSTEESHPMTYRDM